MHTVICLYFTFIRAINVRRTTRNRSTAAILREGECVCVCVCACACTCVYACNPCVIRSGAGCVLMHAQESLYVTKIE